MASQLPNYLRHSSFSVTAILIQLALSPLSHFINNTCISHPYGRCTNFVVLNHDARVSASRVSVGFEGHWRAIKQYCTCKYRELYMAKSWKSGKLT